MSDEHDFSGLPESASLASQDGGRAGLVAAILIPLVGLVFMVVGPTFSATGVARQADSAVAAATSTSADASDFLGAFLQQLGDAVATAGAVMLGGGVLMLAWILSRPRTGA